MKKSLLVISVILLIAGLFISCNSEAAGTNSEVGYVKFGGSKDLTASVDHESGPAISGLYWYYRAIKNGGLAVGQKTEWTRVDNSAVGLAGTIGPFSKGSWYFELVGTTSTSKPSGTSFNTGTSTWTIGPSDGVAYYGVSGTTDEKTRESITLTTGTTVIPVSLKWNKTSSTATVKFDNVSVLDSSETMVLPDETTVYLTVKFGDAVLANDWAKNDDEGENVIYSNSTGFTIPAAELGAKNLYVEVYENSERTSKVQEGRIDNILATAGDIITITGNIGDLEAYYGEFLDSDKEAAVRTSTGTVYYDTLAAAYTAANANETVILNKDVTYGTDHNVDVWLKDVDLDLGGRTFTTNSNQSINLSNNGYEATAICYGDGSYSSSARSVTVKNGTIRTAYGAGIYADGPDLTLTIENVDIRQNYPSNQQATDEYSTALRLTTEAKVVINSGSFYGKYSVVVSNSGGTVTINGGSFSAPLYFANSTANVYNPSMTYEAKKITINGGSFTNFAVYKGTKETESNNVTAGGLGNQGVLIINGGTFDANPYAYVNHDTHEVYKNTATNPIYIVVANGASHTGYDTKVTQ